jgi:hypothetical protein
MILHLLFAHDFVGVVMTEGETIFRLGSFELNFGNAWEVFCFAHATPRMNGSSQGVK